MKLSDVIKSSVVCVVLISVVNVGFAENIDPNEDGSQYAYGENVGWLNFEPSEGPGVTVSDANLTGFVWFQDWNDGCSMKDTNQYEENLIHFIRDIRREFGNKDIPFVIANSGFGGWKQKIDRRLKIIQAQAAPLKHKELKGTAACVETRDFFRPPEVSPSRQGYHWNSNAETYFLIGDSMGRAMIRLCTRETVNGGHRIDCVHPTSTSHILRPTPHRLIPNFPTFQLSDFLFFSCFLPSL